MADEFEVGDNEEPTHGLEHTTSDLQHMTDLQTLVSEHLESALLYELPTNWVSRKKTRHALKWVLKELQRNVFVTSRLADFYIRFQKRGGDAAQHGAQAIRNSFRESKALLKGSGSTDTIESRTSKISKSSDTVETAGTKFTNGSIQSKNTSITFSLSASYASREEVIDEEEELRSEHSFPKSKAVRCASTQKQCISRRLRPSSRAERADVATQTLGTLAMPPKPPATSTAPSKSVPSNAQQKGRRPKVNLSTRNRVWSEFRETPSTTVKHMLLDSMLRINPRGKGCCFYHIGLGIFHNCIMEMATQQCNRAMMPHRGWQCETCFLMEEEYDLNDEPLSVCLLCCCERIERDESECTVNMEEESSLTSDGLEVIDELPELQAP